jgi:hypothetical protein
MAPSTDPNENPGTVDGGPSEAVSQEDAVLAFLDKHEHLAGAVPSSVEEAERQSEALEQATKEAGLALTAKVEAEGESLVKKLQESATEPSEADREVVEGSEPKDKPEATSEAYERSLAALRRYKTPDAAIEAMSPEQVVDWGSRLLKIQADTDRAYTDLRALKEGAQQSDGGEKAGEATRQVEATPTPDLEAVSKEAAELLGLSEKEGGVLGKLFEAVTAPLKRELADRDQRDQLRDNALTELLVERTRRRLEGRFPQLADDGKFGDVLKKAAETVRAGGADTLPQAMEDAARVIFFDDHQTAQASKASKEARTRDASSPATPSPRSAPQSMTLDERMEKTLELLDAGATPEEAARAGGW